MRHSILFLVAGLVGCHAIHGVGGNCQCTFAVERRHTFVRTHPDLSESTKHDILSGAVRRGMTEEEVIASWGPPGQKYRSGGIWGTSEQWVYGATHLFFSNGRLRSWAE